MDVEVAKDKGSYPKITVTVSDLESAFWMKNLNSRSVSQATCSFLGLLPAVSVFFWIVAEDNYQLQRRLPQSRAIERGNSPSANRMHRTHPHRTSHSEFQEYTRVAKCMGFSPKVFKPVWKAVFVKVRVSVGFQLYKLCNCLLFWAIARCKSYVQRLTTTDVCHERKQCYRYSCYYSRKSPIYQASILGSHPRNHPFRIPARHLSSATYGEPRPHFP